MLITRHRSRGCNSCSCFKFCLACHSSDALLPFAVTGKEVLLHLNIAGIQTSSDKQASSADETTVHVPRWKSEQTAQVRVVSTYMQTRRARPSKLEDESGKHMQKQASTPALLRHMSGSLTCKLCLPFFAPLKIPSCGSAWLWRQVMAGSSIVTATSTWYVLDTCLKRSSGNSKNLTLGGATDVGAGPAGPLKFELECTLGSKPTCNLWLHLLHVSINHAQAITALAAFTSFVLSRQDFTSVWLLCVVGNGLRQPFTIS